MVINQIFSLLIFLPLGLIPLLTINKILKINPSLSDSLLTIFIIDFALLLFPSVLSGTTYFFVSFKTIINILILFGIMSVILILLTSLDQIFKIFSQIKIQIDSNSYFRYVTIVFISMMFGFYSIFLPMRGYDALFYYFPNTYIFERTVYILIFNLLIFLTAPSFLALQPIP